MKTSPLLLCAAFCAAGPIAMLPPAASGALTRQPDQPAKEETSRPATPPPATPSPAKASKPDEGKVFLPEIGETLKSLTARYGEGLRNAGKIRIPGHEQYYWEMNRIGFNVVLEDGKAILIVAHRVDGMITKEDIRQLLKANSDIHGWIEDEGSPRWLRRDNKLEAYRELHHEDMFFLQDIAAVGKTGVKTVPGSR